MKRAVLLLLVAAAAWGQSKVWVADRGDGTYKNPILHAGGESGYADYDWFRMEK